VNKSCGDQWAEGKGGGINTEGKMVLTSKNRAILKGTNSAGDSARVGADLRDKGENNLDIILLWWRTRGGRRVEESPMTKRSQSYTFRSLQVRDSIDLLDRS